MARVDLTRHLYTFFPQLEGQELRITGETVADVIDGLEVLAPGIRFYICDEAGRLRQHVNVFVGDERVADRHALTDAVGAETRVLIVQALSGG